MRFFQKVTVNMTSCSELEEEKYEGSEGQEKSLRVANKTLTLLEVLPTCCCYLTTPRTLR